MYMSYTQPKEGIKKEVQKQIKVYKNGTKKQKRIVEKIQELTDNITCFQCLDTQQSWYFRDNTYTNDGNGEYYIMTCAICPESDIRDKWVKDTKTNELYSTSGIKLFNKENYSGDERFAALEARAYSIYPELSLEEPTYKRVSGKDIKSMKKTFFLQVELGNIMEKCKKALQAYCGDIFSLTDLLSNIKINISNCENNNDNDEILCDEIEDKTLPFNKFTYVIISNHSRLKKKSILGLFEINKYCLDVKIHITMLNPTNDTAYKQCQELVSKAGAKELEKMKEIILSIDANTEE